MTAATLVTPAEIETTLRATWEKTEEVDHIRASLFNLLVVIPDNTQEQRVVSLVSPLFHRFPCRALILVQNSATADAELKTEVALDLIGEGQSRAASERIYVRFSQAARDQVPFLIMSHLLPDLPVYVLWTGPLALEEPLLAPLQPYLTQILFAPPIMEQLPIYSKALLQMLDHLSGGVSDLQWASCLGWRHVLASAFDDAERFGHLAQIRHLQLLYSSGEGASGDDLRLPCFYVQAWLAAHLGWLPVRLEEKAIYYATKSGEVKVELIDHPAEAPAGSILNVAGQSANGYRFETAAHPSGEYVTFEGESPQICEIPSVFHLPRLAPEQILAKEFFLGTTSTHYRQTLELISHFPLPGAS
jgi:glucose-6-phosphate dehydrogenase assembly protein OpcA